MALIFVVVLVPDVREAALWGALITGIIGLALTYLKAVAAIVGFVLFCLRKIRGAA